MLVELRAERYTVIERAQVEFGPGLNLLTGETGAGKSILIDALVLLLGGKASSDVVRHGEEKAVLLCGFEATAAALAVLAENGIDAEEDTILLRREITTAGKGRVFINNQPATVGALRQLAPELALVHAQSETTASFGQEQQRELLDRYAGSELGAVAAAYRSLREVTERLLELEDASAERLRMADLWRFQSREIADAAIAGEDEDALLEGEKRILANAEKLLHASMTAYEALYEGESSAETMLGVALKQIEELARYEPGFAGAVQQIAAAKASVEDVAGEVRRFSDSAQASPERLAELEDRLALLDRLKRKYGPDLQAVMLCGAEATQRLNELDNRDELVGELTRECERLRAAYRAAAEGLTTGRRRGAERLAKAAETEINELAMRVRFKVAVGSMEGEERRWSAAGWDEVQFLVATNVGEPLKALDEIASGGEMSRVMLALKVCVEREARVRLGGGRKARVETPLRTLIFDEIDVGIGGGAAEAVGLKLKQLSRAQQVLCITHLPQIAAFADRHYLISKSERGGRTETTVRLLEDAERRQEIARMLSGATLTETSLRHADHLLSTSR